MKLDLSKLMDALSETQEDLKEENKLLKENKSFKPKVSKVLPSVASELAKIKPVREPLPPPEKPQTEFVPQHGTTVEAELGCFFSLSFPCEEEAYEEWEMLHDLDLQEGDFKRYNTTYRNGHAIIIFRADYMGDFAVSFWHPNYEEVYFFNISVKNITPEMYDKLEKSSKSKYLRKKTF